MISKNTVSCYKMLFVYTSCVYIYSSVLVGGIPVISATLVLLSHLQVLPRAACQSPRICTCTRQVKNSSGYWDLYATTAPRTADATVDPPPSSYWYSGHSNRADPCSADKVR